MTKKNQTKDIISIYMVRNNVKKKVTSNTFGVPVVPLV